MILEHDKSDRLGGNKRLVTQIFNLLYRRIAFDESSAKQLQPEYLNIIQGLRIKNPRYGRIPFCVTKSPATWPSKRSSGRGLATRGGPTDGSIFPLANS